MVVPPLILEIVRGVASRFRFSGGYGRNHDSKVRTARLVKFNDDVFNRAYGVATVKLLSKDRVGLIRGRRLVGSQNRL